MVKGIVVDTSILIDHLRLTAKNSQVTTPYKVLQKQYGKVYIAEIVIAELFVGQSSREKAERNRVIKLIGELIKIKFNQSMYRKAGEIARDNQLLDLIDALIATAALHKKLPLATFNKKHFENIRGLKLFDL